MSGQLAVLDRAPEVESNFQLPTWAKFLRQPKRFKVLYGGRGSGKALRNDTRIATPNGWTAMGDLRSGDMVYGSDGKPVKVLAVHPQGVKDEWAMDFSFGETIYCDGDHLWAVCNRLYRKRMNRRGFGYRFEDLEIKTTDEISKTYKHVYRGDNEYAIPIAPALQSPDATLLIDPYVLGAWLGDGVSSQSALTVSKIDYPHFKAMFEAGGETLHPARPCSANDSAPSYPITRGKKGDDKSFHYRLKQLDLLKNKHIPVSYLRASENQRWSLLAGLMDTDGTVDKDGSSAGITSTRECLAQDIYELVVSLGIKCSFRDTPAKYYGRVVGTAYHVEFFPDIRCCRIPRKRVRIRPKLKQKNRIKARMINGVRRTGSKAEMTCITVDSPDGLFLAGRSMIATHNTYSVCASLILMATERPIRVACTREFQNSLEESAFQTIKQLIYRMGLESFFVIRSSTIEGKNGSHFFFRGLERMRDSIKGWEDVDICWVEEGHTLSRQTWELLAPTIRAAGSEIWITFNPKNRTDTAWQTFVMQKIENAEVRKVNWDANPWFPRELDLERRLCEQTEPHRYLHIWEGEPDDTSDRQKVMTYEMLRICVEAWDKRPTRGAFTMAGLDVADTGSDNNAFAVRSGPELFYVDTWKGSIKFTTSETARKAAAYCSAEGVTRLYYDAGGPGAGIRGPLRDWIVEGNNKFHYDGCRFGGEVQSPDIPFLRGTKPATNKQYFANWASQAGWAVRMRADNTVRLHNGDTSVDPDNCLFINPALPNLSSVLAEMAQPEWTDRTGKVKIEKQPKAPGSSVEPPSPDIYDAVIMAFSYDARRGLSQR